MLRLKKLHLRGKYRDQGMVFGYLLAAINIAYMVGLKGLEVEVHRLTKLSILLVIVGVLLLEMKPHLEY